MYICNQCPRKCSVDRSEAVGICGVGQNYKVARAALHYWEEPCISGKKGSGTVFFFRVSTEMCLLPEQQHQ